MKKGEKRPDLRKNQELAKQARKISKKLEKSGNPKFKVKPRPPKAERVRQAAEKRLAKAGIKADPATVKEAYERSASPAASSASHPDSVSGARDHAALAHQYAVDVVTGRIVACKYVRQACQRHLDDLEKSKLPDYPYEF